VTDTRYLLRLFITGASPRSARAIENVRAVCEEYLHDNYDLEIVDVYQRPECLREENLVAAPTLVKSLPLPIRKLVGDMSNLDKMLAGLGLRRPA
jgi:circadian clock protein KaiB